jgi:transcriptional regulator with XRE-family HTH domain
MSAEHFAGRLRELREAAGMSQKALADRVGLTVRHVSRLETGAQKPSWEAAVAVAEALGVCCLAFLEEPSARPAAGRGRPPKAEPAEEKAKRPRGRPRKQAPAAVPSTPPAGELQAEAEAVGRKRRGK